MKESLEQQIVTMTGVYKMYRLFIKKCFEKMEKYRHNIRSLRKKIDIMQMSIQRTGHKSRLNFE
jgi:predicted translin family RNA/ssDNA-binding protein